jgi:hypothetical protein
VVDGKLTIGSKGAFFDRKTLLTHYAPSSKSIDDNRADLASLRLLGSDPLVSVQDEMRSLQNLATNKTTFWRVRSGLALFHIFYITVNKLLRIEL